MSDLHNQEFVNDCVQKLQRLDDDIKNILPQLGQINVRKGGRDFASFCDIIISQQLSNKAADTILARCVAKMTQLSPENILNTSFEELRACGLSTNKVKYLQSLAQDVLEGRFIIEELPQYTDDEVIAVISARKGLGIWSAEIYAMFSLGRANIMPAGDLALQHGLRMLKNLENKPSDKELRSLTAHWQPYLSIGALLLWQLYSLNKSKILS